MSSFRVLIIEYDLDQNMEFFPVVTEMWMFKFPFYFNLKLCWPKSPLFNIILFFSKTELILKTFDQQLLFDLINVVRKMSKNIPQNNFKYKLTTIVPLCKIVLHPQAKF